MKKTKFIAFRSDGTSYSPRVACASRGGTGAGRRRLRNRFRRPIPAREPAPAEIKRVNRNDDILRAAAGEALEKRFRPEKPNIKVALEPVPPGQAYPAVQVGRERRRPQGRYPLPARPEAGPGRHGLDAQLTVGPAGDGPAER